MDNKYKSLGINTALVFVGKLGSGLITFLMLPLYTRWLGPDQFGLADLVNTYSNIILSVATCCMADAIFIFPKTADYDGKCKYFSSGLAVSLIGIIVAFALAFFLKLNPFSSLGTFHSNSFQIVLLSSCLFLQNYTQQFTRSIDKMKVYSMSGIVLSAAIAVYAFLFIPFWGADGYIYSIALANVTAAGYSFIVSGSYKFLSINYLDKSFAGDLLKYGVPLIPNSVMWWLVDGINRPIMEAELGLSAIGIYAVASKFPSVLNVISGAIGNAWGISVSEEYGKDDFNHYFNQIFKLVFFLLMIFSLLMSILAKPIISIFAAPEYIEAYKLLPILLLSVILANASGMVGGIFMAMKQSKYFFYSSIYGATISVIATLILIRLYGVYGVAWASVLSFFVMTIVRLSYVWKSVNNLSVRYYSTSLVIYISFVFALFHFEGIIKYVISSMLMVAYISLNFKSIKTIGVLIKSKISRK